MWFETHMHLADAQFDGDRDEAVRRAQDAGIETMVEIADGPTEWEKAARLADASDGTIFWAAGLHPYFSDQGTDALFDRLRRNAAHPRLVAIGEIGLDYAKCPIAPEVQMRTFETALELARSVDKPVVIHCRDAYSDLLPILRRVRPRIGHPRPGVIHCFSGDAAAAAELVEMGFFLGVDGPLTYPKAEGLRAAVASVGAGAIVLETDSPYLPPQGWRGQRNEPAYLPHIGRRLAELLDFSSPAIAERTAKNARSLFRLDPAENTSR